jgi:hypothetical protein
MVLRLNENELNPNPNIHFITALPDDNDDARQLLRALAAQVRPVMKAHGFVVNSLEEVCVCVCVEGVLAHADSQTAVPI